MADTGWKFPGTAAGGRGSGILFWTAPDNIKVDDALKSTVGILSVANSTSKGLAATNFDFSAIPADSVIDGIEIRVGDYDATASAGWGHIHLILADDSDGTLERNSDLNFPLTSLQTDEVGGATDLWSESLTRADVQNSNFGFFIAGLRVIVDTNISVDFMQMRVFYHELVNTGWKFPATMVGNRAITGSDDNWTNPDNAKADDGSNASVTLLASPDQRESSGLAASNFDFSSIPAGASIDGIEIRVGDYEADNAINLDWDVRRLILADNSDGAENKSSALTGISIVPQTNEAGGATDLWTETGLKRADLQDVDFGFFVGVGKDLNSSKVIDIDFMQMRVFYRVGLPTAIVSSSGVAGQSPPFKSSAGNFYAIVDEGGAFPLQAHKTATPDTDSWTRQDANGAGTMGGITCLSTVQDGDVVHCALGVGGIYRYHTFNMATDLWVISEILEIPDDNPTIFWVSIAVKSNGVPVVAYNADTDQVMGGKKERVDVNVRNGGTWDGAIALDAAGDIHYGNPNIVKGPLTDDMHIVWQQTANTADPPTAWAQTQGRTLDPADVLSTVDTDPGDTRDSLLGHSNLVSYDDAGTQRIHGVGIRYVSGVGDREYLRAIEDGSDNLEFVTPFIIKNDAPEAFVNGEQGISTLAEEGGNLHHLFSGGGADGVDQDLYYTTSTDNGGGWAAPTKELDGITCNFISANIYVRGADTVLAYIYDDGGVQKYNEKVLSTAGTFIGQGTLGNLSVTGFVAAIIHGQADQQGTPGNLPISGFAGEFQTKFEGEGGTPGNLTLAGFAGTVDLGAGGFTGQGTLGTLPLTGLVATIAHGQVIQGTAGTASVTGFAGEFQTQFVGQGTSGTVTATGFAGTADHGQVLQGSVGTVQVSGFAGSVVHGQAGITGPPGTLTVTGGVATLAIGHVLQGIFGQLPVTGLAGQFQTNFVAQGTAGAVTVTGFAGQFETQFVGQGTLGTVTVTGFAGTVDLGDLSFVGQGTAGTVSVTGLAGTVEAGLVVQGTAGSVTVTGGVSTLSLGFVAQGTAATVAVSGFVSTLAHGHVLQGTLGALTATGLAGGIDAGHVLQGTAGNVTVSGFAGEFQTNFIAQGTAGAVTVTGFAGQFQTAFIEGGTAAAVPVTGLAGNLVHGHILQGTLGNLSITGFAGTVDLGADSFTGQGTLGTLAVTGLAGVFCNDLFVPDTIAAKTGVVGVVADLTADDGNWLLSV